MKIILAPITADVIESVSLLFNIDRASDTYFGAGVGVLALNPMRQTLEVFYHPLSVLANMRAAGMMFDEQTEHDELVPPWAERFQQDVVQWEQAIAHTPLVSISQWECIVWKNSYAEKYIEATSPSLFVESDLSRKKGS
jgi:hypothetical protein